MLKKVVGLFCSFSLILTPVFPAAALTDGDDILYAVKATGGSTQDWGTIAPIKPFTSIAQTSPTGLGWPLGDIGSEPDPINGYVFTTQTNSSTSAVDILAIKKSDGSTRWLGLTSSDQVMGYDTKENKLIIHRNSGSNNAMLSFDMVTIQRQLSHRVLLQTIVGSWRTRR